MTLEEFAHTEPTLAGALRAYVSDRYTVDGVWIGHTCCAECEIDPGHRYQSVHE